MESVIHISNSKNPNVCSGHYTLDVKGLTTRQIISKIGLNPDEWKLYYKPVGSLPGRENNILLKDDDIIGQVNYISLGVIKT